MNIDNIMMIHGRLVRDVELKTSKDGKPFVNFSVAVDRRGKEGDKTDFVDCVAFGDSAEHIVKYFYKGKPVRLFGSMECDTYTAKDGTKRYPWKLKVFGWGFDINDPKAAAKKDAPNVDGAFEEADDDLEGMPF